VSSLVEVVPVLAGSAAAVLRVMLEPPHPGSADVDELDAAIAASRLPLDPRPVFERSIVIYLLDTSAISALKRTDTRMASCLSSAGVDDRVVICTISRANSCSAWRDWFQAGGDRNSTAGKLFAILLCEPIPAADWRPIREAEGFPAASWFSADENDLWIAAMALVLDATLVARDSDFRTIEGLALVVETL